MMGSVLRAGRRLLPPSPPSPSNSSCALRWLLAPAARAGAGPSPPQRTGHRREFTTSRVGRKRNEPRAGRRGDDETYGGFITSRVVVRRADEASSGESITIGARRREHEALMGVNGEVRATEKYRRRSMPMRQWAREERCPWTWRDARACAFADLSVEPWPTYPARGGVAGFLKLRPLTEAPGMVFDLNTMSLSVEPTFPERLQYVRDDKFLDSKPWVHKALLNRAKAWNKLDEYDMARLSGHLSGNVVAMNSTFKRHYGMNLSSYVAMRGLAARMKKSQGPPIWARWLDLLGPTVSPSWDAHIDGMEPRDVQVTIETHGQGQAGDGPRILSCVWVAINAPLRHATRDWESLAAGADSYTDALEPVLVNVARWLNDYYDKGNFHKFPYKVSKSEGSGSTDLFRYELPSLRDMVPRDHVVPVVFAYRQKYIWFLWSGGIQGKLVAQYASHWLPISDANQLGDIDVLMRHRQEAMMDELEPEEPEEPEPKITSESE